VEKTSKKKGSKLQEKRKNKKQATIYIVLKKQTLSLGCIRLWHPQGILKARMMALPIHRRLAATLHTIRNQRQWQIK